MGSRSLNPGFASPRPTCDRILISQRRNTSMRRLVSLLAICACALSAQTTKIVVENSEGLAQELAGVSPKAHIVPVNAENVMREIGDADAYVGDITPEQVRAGKRLQWVQVMSAGVEHVLFLSGGSDLRD